VLPLAACSRPLLTVRSPLAFPRRCISNQGSSMCVCAFSPPSVDSKGQRGLWGPR
jgi:hypothetical protein